MCGTPRMNRNKRKAGRTNTEWSAETTESLVRCAQQEFARSGYEEASLERIAQRAKLTKGAIYYHFKNKAGLFEAVFRDAEERIAARIEARARAAPNARASMCGTPRMNRNKRKAGRTNTEWSAETTESLVRCAQQEFARSGYEEASLERIAQRAKLTKGAIYYHFKNKAGLFEAVFRDAEERIAARIEARARAAPNARAALVAGCECTCQSNHKNGVRAPSTALSQAEREVGPVDFAVTLA